MKHADHTRSNTVEFRLSEVPGAVKFKRQKGEWWLPGGWGQGETGGYHLTGTESPFF